MLGKDIYKDYWKSKDKFNFNEGLGLVYERLLLADNLAKLAKKYNLKRVLEAPTRGMLGVPALNSVSLAQSGVEVVLADHNQDYLDEAKKIWDYLGLKAEFVLSDYQRLPFPDNLFDLTWNFASLWRLENFEGLLKELIRTGDNLILIYIPNRCQPGYFLGKFFFNKDYFAGLNAKGLDASAIKLLFKKNGCRIIKEGVFDVPPWPDTCMPISDILRKLKIRKSKKEMPSWRWNSLDYFSGKDRDMLDKIKKISFLENLPIYWRLKLYWAHHRYILCQKISN